MSERVTANFYEGQQIAPLMIWHDASGHVPAIGDYVIIPTMESSRPFGVVSRTWQRLQYGGIDCNLIVEPVEKIRSEGKS